MLKNKISSVVVCAFFSSSLYAASFDNGYLQIVSKRLSTSDTIIDAKDDVVVYSPHYYITADHLIFDKNSSKMELFGDVNIVKDDKFLIHSNYSFFDFKKQNLSMKPYILFDNKKKIWIKGNKTSKTTEKFIFGNTMLSSCDCKDPDWSIRFKKGEFDTKKQWISTYNTTLYFGNIPVFYTPYFGFPTNKDRRTGFLKPIIGYSSSEGFLYAQPIYYAPKDSYDIEYIPQYRKKRGYGHLISYRWADSRYSTLKIKGGYFKENEEYKDEYALKNETHYGWSVDYKRTKLFSKHNSSDGLLLSLNSMNDVDYYNTLPGNNITRSVDKYLESNIKYFYEKSSFYGDLEGNYYDDLSKDNNDEVLQNLPSVYLYKYKRRLFFDNLLYSSKISYSQKIRKEGIGAKIFNMELPLKYTTSFFDDYLNITFGEKLKYTNIDYLNSQSFDNGYFSQGIHSLSLGTDLMKYYSSVIHTIKFDTNFEYVSSMKKDGDIYGVTSENTDLIPFNIHKDTKNITFILDQSLYNRHTLKQIVNHKIKQAYIYDDVTNSYLDTTLENDIKLFYKYGYISNKFIYSSTIKDYSNANTTLKFDNKTFFSIIDYIYSKDLITLDISRSMKYKVGVKFAKYYKVSYNEEYDLTNDISKKKDYIFDIDKKCWSLNLKLSNSLIATNTTDDKNLRQDVLYLELKLKQLFKIGQVYKFNNTKE